MGLSPCAGTGQCVWVASGGRAFSSVGNQEENRARDRTVQVNHYSSAPPGEGSCEDVAFSHPRAAWRKDTPRSAALPTLRCPPVPRGLDTGRGAVPPRPTEAPSLGLLPPVAPRPQREDRQCGFGFGGAFGQGWGWLCATTQCHGGDPGAAAGLGRCFFSPWRAQWKHSKAGHGEGGGMAALGPDSSARPLPESAPPGAEAPAGTRCSAPHPPSGSRRCKSQAKVLGGKEGRGPAHAAFQAAHPSGTHRCPPGVGGA